MKHNIFKDLTRPGFIFWLIFVTLASGLVMYLRSVGVSSAI